MVSAASCVHFFCFCFCLINAHCHETTPAETLIGDVMQKKRVCRITDRGSNKKKDMDVDMDIGIDIDPTM